MRSFAVIAGLAASANAYAYGYPAYNETSSAPSYPAVSTPAGYPVDGAPSSSAPAYGAYSVSSKAPEYPSYATTTIKGLTTVCPEPTTLKVGSKTYTVTKSTTIIDDDCEYTTTVPVKPTPTPVKPISVPAPVKPSSAPAPPPVAPVYPSKNGTAPTYPVATGTPTSTKPAPSQFTGAAAQTGAAMLAIVGAVAAGVFGI
ncbi:hypothetical protein BDU57DRAFT_230942 [Ampelomyces quisqualis]|uniref:Uncharacterized protein n=1 Tax=Ampelomyces quisqualis TaxID=50730 RepID=A0A6A5QPG0_AMPQU|nr:hypothetical protein BDU57DRAFT_230942 [Ampelomyces quisqualis]